MVDKGGEIVSDGSNSYNDLHENFDLDSKVITKKEINTILPWIQKSVSNAKGLLLDVQNR